jgi:hypothetical protein
MNSEPAVGTGAVISAGLALLWIILKQSGVGITEDLKNAVEAFIYALMALPLVAGFLIRFMVTPTAKAEDAIEEAYVATPGVDKKPTL